MASSQVRDGTRVSCTAGGFLTCEPPGKPHLLSSERVTATTVTKGGKQILCCSDQRKRFAQPSADPRHLCVLGVGAQFPDSYMDKVLTRLSWLNGDAQHLIIGGLEHGGPRGLSPIPHIFQPLVLKPSRGGSTDFSRTQQEGCQQKSKSWYCGPFNLDHPAGTTGLLTTGNQRPSAVWHVVRVSLLEAWLMPTLSLSIVFQLPLCKEPGWIHFLQTRIDNTCSARLHLIIKQCLMEHLVLARHSCWQEITRWT